MPGPLRGTRPTLFVAATVARRAGRAKRTRRSPPRYHLPVRDQEIRKRCSGEDRGRAERLAKSVAADDPSHHDRPGADAGVERRADYPERGPAPIGIDQMKHVSRVQLIARAEREAED